jgi:hypothetical protein
MTVDVHGEPPGAWLRSSSPSQTARHGLTRPAASPAQKVPGRDLLAPDQDDRNDVHPEQPGPAPQPHAANHSCRPWFRLGQQVLATSLFADLATAVIRWGRFGKAP